MKWNHSIIYKKVDKMNKSLVTILKNNFLKIEKLFIKFD
jgi:hypothetical protein